MIAQTEEKLMEELHRRIQYQLNHTWLNLIDSTQKDHFLNNFSEEDKIAGLVLLDMLLFHNQAQEKQLMRTLIRKLHSHIYKSIHPRQEDNSEEIISIITEEMNHIAFIPVIDKNPADSSNSWSAIVRELTGTSDCFYDIDNLPLLLSLRKKYIVFYDDMLGTGTQFDNYLNKERFKISSKKNLSIRTLMDANQEIAFYYLCLAGHTDGIARIERTYPQIHVVVSELFDDEDSVLSKSNENWAYYEDAERDKIIEILERIISSKKIEDPFTKNLPVIFERNRPSNTACPLYWYSQNQWIPIKAREGT